MDEDTFGKLYDNKKRELEDFNVMNDIIKNKLDIAKINDETLFRIISLCCKKSVEINNRIQNTKAERLKVEALIKELNKNNL